MIQVGKKKSNFIFEKERYLLSLETNIELYIKWPKQMRLDMFSICTIAISIYLLLS